MEKQQAKPLKDRICAAVLSCKKISLVICVYFGVQYQKVMVENVSENDDKPIIFVQQVISADTCSSNRYFLPLLWLVLADRLVLMMPVPKLHT